LDAALHRADPDLTHPDQCWMVVANATRIMRVA
jgi:hypothetical protein